MQSKGYLRQNVWPALNVKFRKAEKARAKYSSTAVLFNTVVTST